MNTDQSSLQNNVDFLASEMDNAQKISHMQSYVCCNSNI